MVLYNVAVPVVALVEAKSPEDAIKVLSRNLAREFDVYEGELPDGAHAFESEPIECTCPTTLTLSAHEKGCPIPDMVVLS